MRTDLNDHALVAWSPQMQAVLALAERIAAVPWNVVLTGPTGVGKGVIAKYIHRLSRADRPWVHLPAGRLVDSLMGSQLQGYTRGSFTGSGPDSRGVLEDAADGTLFLDEVHHLTLPTQVALLEALSEGTVTRLGAHRSVAVRCRFIFGTGIPLDELGRTGRILPDFRQRLGMIEIEVPPLASRRGDILPLAERFLRLFGAELGLSEPPPLSPEAVRALLVHPWPGNVRELEGRVQRALLEVSTEAVEPRHFTLGVPADADLGRMLDPSERRDVARYVLHATGRTQQGAADLLGISRNTFLRWLGGAQEDSSPSHPSVGSVDSIQCTTGDGAVAAIGRSAPRKRSGMRGATRH